MADASRFIDRAERLMEKGKPDQALAELRSAIELQPDNDALLQRTADLALSIGKLGIASDMLRRLFVSQVEGCQLAASAVTFRKLQRMKALEPDVVRHYAELCENTNRRDSAEAYRVAFQEFQRLGDARRALDCITQALRLDPRIEDYREQARIAEALHEPAQASAAMVQVGVMLERSEQDPAEAYEQAFAYDGNNLAARLGHGRGLLAQRRYEETIELLRELAAYPSSPEEAREPYTLALLALGRVEDAEPFVWGLFERNPGKHLNAVHEVIEGLLNRNLVDRALPLARRLEEFSRKAGKRGEFMQDMTELSARCKPSIAFVEYLAELYNSANREVEYSQILGRLFNLYFDAGNYARALDALDRAVDIDPYEAEHSERMKKLAGHAPEERLQTVAKRLGVEPPEMATVTAPVDEGMESATPDVAEDLILQAEIFLQYGMRDKALQKIELLKPCLSEELYDDPRVKQLFLSAGVALPERMEPGEGSAGAADAMARVAEVSRVIARQSDPRQVLVSAVNQIGTRWHFSRCLAALASPGKPPSLVVEYCSPEVAKSERSALVRLLALSQRLVVAEPVFRAAEVQLSEPLAPVRQELAKLGVTSLMVVAIEEDDQPVGLLILQQCGVRRRWTADDVAVQRSLADSIALAVHGARLRSLVSTLGVAEEETGLLKRSSYLGAVVAELGRRTAGDCCSTLALLQVVPLSASEPDGSMKELVRTLRSLAQDQAMPFRYSRDTVALLLPQMEIVEAESLVLRLREALESIAIAVTAGIAMVGATKGVDPEDAATEWVNRVARALAAANTVSDRLCILPPGTPLKA